MGIFLIFVIRIVLALGLVMGLLVMGCAFACARRDQDERRAFQAWQMKEWLK